VILFGSEIEKKKRPLARPRRRKKGKTILVTVPEGP
jgi:hypothetical protein